MWWRRSERKKDQLLMAGKKANPLILQERKFFCVLPFSASTIICLPPRESDWTLKNNYYFSISLSFKKLLKLWRAPPTPHLGKYWFLQMLIDLFGCMESFFLFLPISFARASNLNFFVFQGERAKWVRCVWFVRDANWKGWNELLVHRAGNNLLCCYHKDILRAIAEAEWARAESAI
jgi:hypothetical protein